MSVLLNTGSGFAKADYATGSSPRFVASADVNGDGRADLIVANHGSASVSVLMGDGAGSFAQKVDVAAGAAPQSVTIADVNGDGKADLVVASYDSGTVGVLLGSGNGTFAAKVDYLTNAFANHAIGTDVNADGKADLVVASLSHGISVLLNSSTPIATGFTEQTAVAVSAAITLADANGDADWDGGSLVAHITANGEAADSLGLATANPGGSGIWVDTAGNKLMAGAMQIGTASAASVSNSAPLSFNFLASATNALVQETARALQFNNSSDTPGLLARSVTFTATDKHAASVSAVQAITVAAVNDAPVLADVPGTAQAVTAGVAAALPDFTVADADSSLLALTLTAVNGTLGGLTDADAAQAGIQLAGTAAALNAALAGATFSAAAAGAAGIGFALNDGVAAPVTASYALSATAAPTVPLPVPPAPVPVPVPPVPAVPPVVTPPAPAVNANGLTAAQENGAPGLTGSRPGVAGDGNGDGVQDSLQAGVASAPFLASASSQSLPGNAAVSYVTLVAGSLGGKADPLHPASLSNVVQLDAPAKLPPGMTQALGLIAFDALVPNAGATEKFSLYVAPSVGANGLWARSGSGVWVNLASEAYGGALVAEGGKLRLDFLLKDGGSFDADGKADGVIKVAAAAGFMELSIVGQGAQVDGGAHFWS